MRIPLKNEIIDSANPICIKAFETHYLNDPLHFHPDEFELTLVLGGSGIRFVGSNISQFGNCDLVLTAPGLPHSWMFNYTNQNGTGHSIQIITIQFNRHIVGEQLLQRKEFKDINNLLSRAEYGILFNAQISKFISQKILQLKLEFDFDTFLSILDILNKLANTDDYQELCRNDFDFRGKFEEADKFESVFNHIQSNFLSKIKISEVASIIGLNDSAFSHYFKKRTHYSFTDFINELRLNHATQLMLSQNKNIADICFESGFNNLSNFNRMFKKWKGITPLQYRKKKEITKTDEPGPDADF
jgi:AraC-like DNA-binding protein